VGGLMSGSVKGWVTFSTASLFLATSSSWLLIIVPMARRSS